MTDYYHHKGGEPCPVCGILAFSHWHPDKDKPREFLEEREEGGKTQTSRDTQMDNETNPNVLS